MTILWWRFDNFNSFESGRREVEAVLSGLDSFDSGHLGY